MTPQIIEATLAYAKKIREHIHAHPELSFEEYETSKFIKQELDSLGIQASSVAGTGWVACIQGKNPELHCIGFRADFDALPIMEKNDVPYKSVHEGIMHACGHDFHTACLLGAAKILVENNTDWHGTVKLLFQPGEEKDPGGATLMIRDGVLEQPSLDAVFALHAYPALPVGQVGARAGTYMASADEVYITIKGKGGHAATPHLCIDPIAISAHVIIALQNIVSRIRNPIDHTVLTIGKIAGGTKGNIIPNEVILEGTLRCMNEQWRAECHTHIKQHVESICAMYGAIADVKILVGYPCVHNDEVLTAQAQSILASSNGNLLLKELPLRMTADDFSFYTHHIPGCYIRIGTASADSKQYTSPVHTDTFDIDPQALITGMQVICDIVRGYTK